MFPEIFKDISELFISKSQNAKETARRKNSIESLEMVNLVEKKSSFSQLIAIGLFSYKLAILVSVVFHLEKLFN